MRLRQLKNPINLVLWAKAVSFAEKWYSENYAYWHEFLGWKERPNPKSTLDFTADYPCGIVTIPQDTWDISRAPELRLEYHKGIFAVVDAFDLSGTNSTKIKRFFCFLPTSKRSSLVSCAQVSVYYTDILGLEDIHYSLCLFSSRFTECQYKNGSKCSLFGEYVGQGFEGHRCSQCRAKTIERV